MKFKNRSHAGQLLASKLENYSNQKNTIILALPRGGVPVAYEVAKKLNLPWDIFVVRKLGMPGHEELAIGAIAEDGTIYFNQIIIQSAHLPHAVIQQAIEKEKQELHRRVKLYRGYELLNTINQQHIILIDDGLATGATMHAAVTALQNHSPLSITIAIPVAANETIEGFRYLADVTNIVTVQAVDSLMSVGMWYHDFSQTTDEEVLKLKQKQ